MSQPRTPPPGVTAILSATLCAFPSDLITIINNYLLELQSLAAAGFDFTIVRAPDGTLRAFGRNVKGQLGDGTFTTRSSPITIPNIRDVKGVAVGSQHTIVLKDNGTLVSFGLNNFGQLGFGSTKYRQFPATIRGIFDAQAVACGENHTVVLLADGTLRTFGDNNCGQLGNGQPKRRDHDQWLVGPTEVPNIRTAQAIACGKSHTIVLMRDGTLRAFGHNFFSQLGDGSITQRREPVVVPNIHNAQAIACGSQHTVVLLKGGALWTFGCNERRQLGLSGWYNSMVKRAVVPQLVMTGVEYVACSHLDRTFAVMQDRTVVGWGSNKNGELGDGSTAEQHYPSKSDADRVIAVFCGYSHTIVLHEDGSLRAFGDNRRGQLGAGALVSPHYPVLLEMRVF